MYKICRINIGKGKKIYKEIDSKLKKFAERVRKKYSAKKILIFGSYVRKDLNEGSDIDLIIVGNFKEKFHKRIANVLALTDLPIEPLCYTEEEFKKMVKDKNTFMSEVLSESIAI